MELEERLNKIASKAVREPDEEEFTNPFKSSVSKPTSTSKEKIDVNDLRQLTIEAQLAKISTNAIQDKLGSKPSKIKSDVTKEMILDYQNEMLKPIEVGGVKYKYHPSSIDIDLEEYVPPNRLPSDDEISDVRNERLNISKELPKIEKRISFLNKSVLDVRDKYDRDIAETILRYQRYEDFPLQQEKQREITFRFERALDNLQRLIDEEQAKYANGIAYIDGVNQALEELKMKQSENQAEETRVKNINKARLKAYEEDLKLLNRGRLNVTQEEGESEEDYKERLRQTGQMTVSEDDMANSADLYNRDKLRELVLELVRDTGIISNAIKFLDQDQVFKINQNWSRIKRDFLKAYGFDNKTVKEQDLIDFFLQEVEPIIDAINKGKAPPTADLLGEIPEAVVGEVVEAVAEPKPKKPKLKTFAELQTMGADALKAYYLKFKKAPAKWNKKLDDIRLFIQEADLVADKNPDGSDREIEGITSPPLGSSLGAKKTHTIAELEAIAQPVFDKLTAEWERITSTSADEDRRTLGGVILAKIGNAEDAFEEGDKDKFYRSLNELEDLVPDIIRREARMAEIYPREITGNGLQPIKHDIPNLIEFGKVKISPRKLYYNNTLAIKHKSGNSLVGLPNVQVSDKFVSIIMNLLKGKKPSLKDFTQLDLNEKGIYDSLIYIAGLQKEVDNNFGETKQQLKNRLELIEGSISAGNTNPSLKKELHALLGKMAHTGMIGYGDAKRYYASVCK